MQLEDLPAGIGLYYLRSITFVQWIRFNTHGLIVGVFIDRILRVFIDRI